MSKKRTTFYVVLGLTIMLIPVFMVSAQGLVPTNCQGTNCQVNDFAVLAVNISNWILRFAGAFALLFFVYGGFLWVTAAGSASRVEHGRNVLVGTVIALVIILGAFTIVQFIGSALGVSGSNFDRFLGGSSGGGGVCANAGDACTYPGTSQNVYACTANGSCSSQTLCNYWSAQSSNPYGITATHICIDQSTSSDPSKCVSNLCAGKDNIRCCPR